MRLLLDTNVLLPITQRRFETLPGEIASRLRASTTIIYVSAASLWEVSIKHRLGKLPLQAPLDEFAAKLADFEITILPITPEHALAEAQPVPATRDPFDRLLLAVCAVENLRLLTTDRALAAHPLAWAPDA